VRVALAISSIDLARLAVLNNFYPIGDFLQNGDVGSWPILL